MVTAPVFIIKRPARVGGKVRLNYLTCSEVSILYLEVEVN